MRTRYLRAFVSRRGDGLRALLSPEGGGPAVWRSMAFLYVFAGAITLATLVTGVDSDVNEPVIAGLGVVAVLSGLAIGALARHIPEEAAAALLLTGLLLVSLAVVASGDAESPYALFYIWVGVEAWFFLSVRRAIALTAATIVISWITITQVEADSEATTWWVAIVGSLLAVSTLAGALHGRAQRLIVLLRDAATTDELTGLLNRRGYQDRLRDELARARRHGTPLSIVLGDLDEFKALNDRFGHREGDKAIQRFADICRRQLRGIDLISRVGGEEFAIVLPVTGEGEAILTAERLRRAVRTELRTPDGTAITASFGVATHPQHGTDGEKLLDHADQAMYAAKALGRDRTVAFSEELPAAKRTDGQQHLQAVVLIAETLDLRDAGTREHSATVARLCEQVARALELPPCRVEQVRLAGLLHDVGKIGVPDHVLRKPGRLDPAEWAEMRKHPELGARVVEGAGFHDIAEWVLAHHERPDGKGYPYGLAGEDIPLEARILAVADAYEAMTADRPYRAALGQEVAVAELERGAGSQFDPDIVRIFLTVAVGQQRAAA